MSNTKKKIFFLFCLIMLAFYIYVQYFATREAKVFLGVWNVDKLFHIMGGISLAIFFEWTSPRQALLYLLIFIAALAIGWEIFEYTFLPDVTYFANHSPDLWRIDTAGDIVAAFLGAYGYWVFFKNADSPPHHGLPAVASRL